MEGMGSDSRKQAYLILGLTSALALAWPLPHTIALRNVLMAFLMMVLFPQTQWNSVRELLTGPGKRAAIIYAVFTAWILFVAFFISPFPHWTLSEITGQWLSAAVALALGLLTASQGDSRLGRIVVVGLLVVLSVQVAAVDAQGLWIALSDGNLGQMARLGGLSAGPGKASYLTNFLLCGLIAELSLRMEGRRNINISSLALGTLLSLCVLSIYFEAMRNELFDVAVFMFFVGLIGYQRYSKATPKRALIVATASVLILVGLIIVDAIADPRWNSLWATIPIALDTTRHLAWLNGRIFPLPHLPDGHVVSASNYLRIAWIKEGLYAIIEHPLGVGFGRSAFGHALMLRYGSLTGDTGLNNSLITIGIGTGIPGLALWLGWFISLGRFSLKRFSGPRAFYARFLLLIILAFGIRMAMDNVMQNYTLEQVLYFFGLLGALCVSSSPAARAVTAGGGGQDEDRADGGVVCGKNLLRIPGDLREPIGSGLGLREGFEGISLR